ncbi:hypothetical protein B0T21DRAFT_358540 [Apiosordaria backusii]|uniref:Zn(2)-C6 fungal-type domain-containing protein n=1 Tax=Apiosordaria backusii TaxID=314023 RepID=A0AA40K3U0_9PEZI|nr:hypothetical protein B0T21DRAFT_358540 [Apiosordaria backusii]
MDMEDKWYAAGRGGSLATAVAADMDSRTSADLGPVFHFAGDSGDPSLFDPAFNAFFFFDTFFPTASDRRVNPLAPGPCTYSALSPPNHASLDSQFHGPGTKIITARNGDPRLNSSLINTNQGPVHPRLYANAPPAIFADDLRHDMYNFEALESNVGVPFVGPIIGQPGHLPQWEGSPNTSDGFLAADLSTNFGPLADALSNHFNGCSSDSSPDPETPVPVQSRTPPSAELQQKLAPNSVFNLDTSRRPSIAATEIKIEYNVRSSPSPRPPNRKAGPKSPTGSLEIIQYKPSGKPDGRLSKKRPAFDEITTGSSTPQTLRRISLEDESGQVKATMTTFGKRPRIRTTFDEEKRRRTALARKEGVCARCKRSKRQCDLAAKSLYVSCTLCACTKIYKNVPRMPCFRSTLVDVLFFRAGPAANEPLFTRRLVEFKLEDLSAPDVPVRTVKLTQKMGQHRLTVYASEFKPEPTDKLSYHWKDSSGNSHEMKMPPFTLTNLDKIHAHFRQYIDSAKWSYLESLKGQQDDDLTWMTVSMAMEYARRRPDSLVADTLDMWAVSRMIEIPWEICGQREDTLGMSAVREPENPHNGKIPIPPIMDTLLDQIVIKNFLRPLRERVINKFEQLISPARPEVWFEIYLTAFIILNHIERLAKHSASHARLHSMPTKYSNTSFLEGAFHTAKVILSRFHFVCNGAAPLRLDWKKEKTVELAKLQPDEVALMEKTQAIIRRKQNDVLSLRKTHQYERPLYWCHQLYFEEWDTSPVHIVEE